MACHSIFDIELSECFRRKARFAADGHKVSIPPSMSCSTVVPRDSVGTSLLVTALNDLDVLKCNVQNAFLPADNLKKHHLVARDEFGHEKGKVSTVVGVLCRLKSASAAFRSFMAKKLDEMNSFLLNCRSRCLALTSHQTQWLRVPRVCALLRG